MIREAIFSLLSIFLIFSGNCAAVEIIPTFENEESVPVIWDYMTDNVLFIR